MKEQFVPYEIALKLKEKGFNEKCFGFFLSNERNKHTPTLNLTIRKLNENVVRKECCSAPLWLQVIDWLAEKHNIDISIPPFYDAGGRLYTAMYFLKSDGTLISDDENTFMLGEFDTKQEARRAAILHALTII
jgi:hypothetical protein